MFHLKDICWHIIGLARYDKSNFKIFETYDKKISGVKLSKVDITFSSKSIRREHWQLDPQSQLIRIPKKV